MKTNDKRIGISLLLLVITIIVVIILSSAVILSIVQNNPISQANEATFKSDLDAVKSDLSMYISSQYASDKAYDPNSLNANELSVEYNGTSLPGKTIKDIISVLNTTDKYNGQFEIVDGKLVYVGADRTKKRWAQDISVDVLDADRLDAVITSDVTLPVSAGTDVVVTIKYSSNASIDTINLTDKLELLDANNVVITNQPDFVIGTPSGTNADALRTVNVTIKTDALMEGSYKLRLKPASVYNIYDVTMTKETVTNVLFEIDNTPPTNPITQVDSTSWTNGSVNVTITYPADATIKEYSTDGTNWSVYTAPITVTDNNTTIYARATDISGNQSGQSTITIANIDKESPTVAYAPNGGNNLQTISTKVTVTDIGVSNVKSDSLQYAWDTQNVAEPTSGWTTFTNGDTITHIGDNTYYLWIKALDNAGNPVVSKSDAFGGDITPPENPTISSTPTGWTNGNVTVTITYPSDSAISEYSTDGTTWSTYSTPIIVTTNNTTVYARATDLSGNQSGQSTITIANIDKTAPTVTFGTNGGTNIQIASTTVTVSDLAGSNVNATTLQYTWDTQNVTTPTSGWTTFTNAATITKTGVTATYYLWIQASDNAGNIVVSKSNAFGVDVTPPINPTMSATPTGWTNGNVTVTITYPADANVKEYSTNGTTWSAYSAPVVVTVNNTTIYARATDLSGNQSGQSTLTVSNIDKDLPLFTNVLSGGRIYADSNFQSGSNSTVVYNNLANGTVTNTRVAMSDSPTGSGYGMEVRTTGTASPGWGGFYFATQSSANKVFITKIIASIPVGYTINWASNAIGDTGTHTWLTSQNGTGTWQEYICKVTCGSAGTFSSTNFFYLAGGTTPTSGSPLIWRVAYATVFDTTIWNTTSNIIASATDTSGIVGYGINQSSVTPPAYINISARSSFATVFENITTNGTYYVWLRDQAGNNTNSSITVSYIDTISPTVTFGTNGATGVTSAATTVTVNDTGGSNINTNTLQYVWDTQNVTQPSSGWTSFTNGSTVTKFGQGTYYLWVRASDNAGNSVVSKSNAFTTVAPIYNFDYTGSVRSWTVPYTATYRMEVWGAQGNGTGGRGAYARGDISLTAGQTIYIYVGGINGFNGGGVGGTGARPGFNGGGATDIRTLDTLANRVIVAGGGGGSGGNSNGGSPNNPDAYPGGVGGAAHFNGAISQVGSGSGGLGYAGNISSGGAGGSPGTLSSTSSSDGSYYQAGGGGGGGGYYGGGGGGSGSVDGSSNNVAGQSGIAGALGVGGRGGNSTYTYAVTGYHSYPGGGGGGGFSYAGGLGNAVVSSGNDTFIAPAGTNETGHAGNGYARITIIN